MARPRAVLCDLDDTLFDHAYATRCALAKLREVEPGFQEWTIDELDDRHRVILERLHLTVLAGERTIEVARVERFQHLLDQAGARDRVNQADACANFYRRTYLEDWRVVPGGDVLLDGLAAAKVPVIIVTNNGVAEQRLKLERCDLTRRISALITSEEVGFSKPDRRIFDAALSRAGVQIDEAVMFGDAWGTDIEGARRIGMRAVWLNRKQEAAPASEVRQLSSLDDTAQALSLLMDW